MKQSKVACPDCEDGALTAETYSSEFRYNGRAIRVDGLERYRCEACGSDPVLNDQIKRNQNRIADAKRGVDRLLTGDQIRRVRELLGISQADAAQVFGGGGNAFSKYERGEVVQSVPMDRLLRIVADNPALLNQLAAYAGMNLAAREIVDQQYVDMPPHIAIHARVERRTQYVKLSLASSLDYADAA